jgi:hypothetical protein
MNQLLRIEGSPDCDNRQWGMPDPTTITEITDATYAMLANEIPGFQIGPNIGRSMLGIMATLDVLQDVVSSQLAKDTGHNPSKIFRYTRQTPLPFYNELARTAPAVPLEFMATYQLPPHVDRGECGLAVHLQADAVEREVQLAHLRSEGQPLVVEKTIGGLLAPNAVQYKGPGMTDERFADFIGGPVHYGTTSEGVMTVFSEGNMNFPSLNGTLKTSLHFFKNPPRNVTSSWTRFTGRERDHELSPHALGKENSKLRYTMMHMHAAQIYKDLTQEHGVHPEDIGSASLADSADVLANVLLQLKSETCLTPEANLALLRYSNHPGHASGISYSQESGPLLWHENDLPL